MTFWFSEDLKRANKTSSTGSFRLSYWAKGCRFGRLGPLRTFNNFCLHLPLVIASKLVQYGLFPISAKAALHFLSSIVRIMWLQTSYWQQLIQFIKWSSKKGGLFYSLKRIQTSHPGFLETHAALWNCTVKDCTASCSTARPLNTLSLLKAHNQT